MTTDLVAALRGDIGVLRSHPFDPDDPFWRAADDHGVHLIIADIARSLGAVEDWSPVARARARRAAVDASVVDTLRARELRRVLGGFQAAGVPCLLMKGAALAHALDAHPHLRPRRDTDILIRPDDVPCVDALLQDAGYIRATETSGELATFQRHFDRAGVNGSLHAIDVHWRVANPQLFAYSVDYDDLAASRVPVPALGPHAWTTSLSHTLVLACIHRVAHHQDSDRLLWIWDIHQLMTACSEQDAARVVDLASKASMRAVCAHTLEVAAAQFHTRSAPKLIARVRPVPGAEAEASARFLGGGLRLVDILQADLTTLGWRRGATLLREHLLPPADYMRSIYRGWPAALLPVAYLHRVVRGAPKWFRRPPAPIDRPRLSKLARVAMLVLAGAACVNLAAGVVLALRDPARAGDLWSMYDWCRRWLLSGERLYTGPDAITDYPPNAIVLLSPLALVPPHWLVPLWTAGALALAPALAYVVTRCASRGDRSSVAVPMLLFLCWTSTRTLLQFSALSMTLAFMSLLFVDAHWVASGVLLGLALFKPHIAGPVALYVSLTGRARVAIVAAVVVVGGWAAYDARTGEPPLATVSGYWHVLADVYGGRDGLMGKTSIRAWTHAGVNDPRTADVWWLCLSALLLAIAAWLATRGPRRAVGAAALAGPALLCLWSLLAIYHHVNNLILMLPALAFVWWLDDERSSLRRWVPLALLQAVLTVDVPTRLTAVTPPGGWIRLVVEDVDRVVVVVVFVYVAALWYRVTRQPTPS